MRNMRERGPCRLGLGRAFALSDWYTAYSCAEDPAYGLCDLLGRAVLWVGRPTRSAPLRAAATSSDVAAFLRNMQAVHGEVARPAHVWHAQPRLQLDLA